MCRNQLAASARRGGFLSVLPFQSPLSRSPTSVPAFCSVWGRRWSTNGCPRFEGGRVRRDGSQATEAVRGARRGDTTMRKSDDPALRDYDDYVASALRTEGGHLSIGRGGFILWYAGGARLSGYDCEQIKGCCIAAGLPVIDSR